MTFASNWALALCGAALAAAVYCVLCIAAECSLLHPLRRTAMFIVDHVPLRGPFAGLAPWLFGFAINRRPRRVKFEKPPSTRWPLS